MEEQSGAQAPAAENKFAVIALKELSRVDKGIAKLKQTYGNVVYDVSTTKGIEQAKKARAAIREPRYAVEKIRATEASKIKAAQTALNEEARRITAEILAIEEPIHQQIVAEEERKEREKQEAIRQEAERVNLIRSEIDRLAGTPARVEADGLPVGEIEHIIHGIGSTELDKDFYKEFLSEAEHTRAKVIGELHTLIAKIQLREEEAARIKAQTEELEALRRQLAEAQALLAKHASPVAAAVSEVAGIGAQIADEAIGSVCIKAEAKKVVAVTAASGGVIESPHQGQPIDPATESWTAADLGRRSSELPIELLDTVGVEEDRLFDDGFPGVDKIVSAVATQLGISEELAKSYIIQAGEDLSFQGA